MGAPTAQAKFIGKPPSASPLRFTAANFSMWVDHTAGAQATMTVDKTMKHSLASGGVVKVEVSQVGSNPDCVDIRPAPTVTLRKGVVYNLTFWAKASAAGVKLQLNARMDHAPWSGYGLDSSVELSSEWQSQSMTFSLPSTFDSVSDAWLSFFLGQTAGVTVWIDSVSLGEAAAPVTMRTFTCGAAILNGSPEPQTVSLPVGYSRLVGSQAPKHQYVVDDGDSTAFTAGSGWAVTACRGEANKQPPVNATCFVHGYDFNSPSEEENQGPVRTHTHTHTRTHTRTHARARARTHTHTETDRHTERERESTEHRAQSTEHRAHTPGIRARAHTDVPCPDAVLPHMGRHCTHRLEWHVSVQTELAGGRAVHSICVVACGVSGSEWFICMEQSSEIFRPGRYQRQSSWQCDLLSIRLPKEWRSLEPDCRQPLTASHCGCVGGVHTCCS